MRVRFLTILAMAIAQFGACSKAETPIAALSAPLYRQAYRRAYETAKGMDWERDLGAITRVQVTSDDQRLCVLSYPVSDGIAVSCLSYEDGTLRLRDTWTLETGATVYPTLGTPRDEPVVFATAESGKRSGRAWYISPWTAEVVGVKCQPDDVRPGVQRLHCAGLASVFPEGNLQGLHYDPENHRLYIVTPQEKPDRGTALWVIDAAIGTCQEQSLAADPMLQPRMSSQGGKLRIFGLWPQTDGSGRNTIAELVGGRMRVVSDPELSVTDMLRPFALAVDGQGQAHLFYEAQSGHQDRILLAHSYELAGVWNHEVVAELGGIRSAGTGTPSAVVGLDGSVHVCFFNRSITQIIHGSEAKGTWHFQRVAEASEVWSLSAAAIDGHIALVWADGKRMEVYARMIPMAMPGLAPEPSRPKAPVP